LNGLETREAFIAALVGARIIRMRPTESRRATAGSTLSDPAISIFSVNRVGKQAP
jgi:hypothetical protein